MVQYFLIQRSGDDRRYSFGDLFLGLQQKILHECTEIKGRPFIFLKGRPFILKGRNIYIFG